jgi:hypothetical protein
MNVRKTIFDNMSKAELFYGLQSRFDSITKADLFYALQPRWSHTLRVFPSLLLSKIIEMDADTLSPKKRKMFNQSAVDFTFCDLDGRFLFSLDFDEVGGGFSRRDVYNEGRESLAPAQKEEIEFKLSVAYSANYPLIVVSDEEIRPVDFGHESFTVVDGIVGQFVTMAGTKKLFDDKTKASEPEIEEIESEVGAEINPIVKKVNEYRELCFGENAYSSSIRYFYDPPLPVEKESDSDHNRRADMSRVQDMALRVGCGVVIKAPQFPNIAIDETFWLRNFGSYTGSDGLWRYEISARSVARDIAQYKALKKAFLIVTQSF